MKIKENVTLYCCDFCKKELKVRHAMEKHETICLNNPMNHKACQNGCSFLEQIEMDVPFVYGYHPDHGESSGDQTVKVFRCAKFDKLMYPFSIERKDLANKYPNTYDGQEPMPKDCEGFSDKMPWENL